MINNNESKIKDEYNWVKEFNYFFISLENENETNLFNKDLFHSKLTENEKKENFYYFNYYENYMVKSKLNKFILIYLFPL